IIDSYLSGNRESRGPGMAYFLIVMVLEMVLGLFATMIAMWFSRRREFRADAGGASLAGRAKMIAALERLEANHRPSTLPAQVEAFGIAGGIGQGLKKLFLSHPPMQERIAALRQQATATVQAGTVR
ncbi:M48 family metalloprotease, partial [Xanthomonas citri pv. citri]